MGKKKSSVANQQSEATKPPSAPYRIPASHVPKFDAFLFRDEQYFQINNNPIPIREVVLLLRTTREVLVVRPICLRRDNA